MRLQRACEYLEQGNIEQLGKLMFQTHEGLSNRYEVSCKESDYLINAVKNDSSVLGARMMGGGFGGCTINIIKRNSADQIIEKLAYSYKKDMQITLSAYFVKIESGTELLKV
jgi:galactokinase